MQRNDFYELSGQQQQGYVPRVQGQQQKAKANPVQPHQKLNVISSRQAEAIRTGDDSGNSGCPNPVIAKCPPKKVEPELIEKFMMGMKNPVMALNEFCQKQRLSVKFQEDTASSWGSSVNPKFASVATVDGVRHKQGIGRTKKEAKSEAAKVALSTLLGLTPEDVLKPEIGTVIYDSRGRKLILLEEEPVAKTMATHPDTERSYTSGGHYQVNTNSAPILTSEDAWNVNKQETYAEYQMKLTQQTKQKNGASSRTEAVKAPAVSTPAQSAPPRPTGPQPVHQPSTLSFGRGVLNQDIMNSCLQGTTSVHRPAPGQQAHQPVPGVRQQNYAGMHDISGQGYQPQTTGFQPPQGTSQPQSSYSAPSVGAQHQDAPGKFTQSAPSAWNLGHVEVTEESLRQFQQGISDLESWSSSGSGQSGPAPSVYPNQEQSGYQMSTETDAFPKLTHDSAVPQQNTETSKQPSKPNSQKAQKYSYKPHEQPLFDFEDACGTPFPQFGVQKKLLLPKT